MRTTHEAEGEQAAPAPLAPAAPAGSRAGGVLRLQERGGNAGVSAVLARPEAVLAAPARPLLRTGSRGPDVSDVQARLNTADPPAAPPLAVDGIFGPLTRGAVVSFQGAAGLVPDGIVGPLTQAALDARRGAPGPPGTLTAQQEADAVAFAVSTYDQQSVRIIQGQVGIPPTGVFDGATAQAVGRFQAARGLPVNGRVEDPALTPMVAERVAVGMHDQAIHLVADFNGLDMTTDTLSVHLDVALAAPALSDVRFESGNLRLIRLGPGAFASPIVLRDQIRARLQDPAPAFVVAPAPPPLIDPISAQITALLNANRLGDPRSVRAIQGLVGAFPDGAWTPDLVQRVAFFQQQSAIPPNGLVDEGRTLPAMSDRLIAIGEQDAVLRIIVDFFDLADDGELLSIYFDPNIGTGRVPFAFVRREDNQPASIQVGPTAFQQPFAGLVHVVAHEMEHIRQLVGGPATSAAREFL